MVAEVAFASRRFSSGLSSPRLIESAAEVVSGTPCMAACGGRVLPTVRQAVFDVDRSNRRRG